MWWWLTNEEKKKGIPATAPVETHWFWQPGLMGLLQNALLTCGFWSPVTEHRWGTILLRLSVWVPYLRERQRKKGRKEPPSIMWSCKQTKIKGLSFTLYSTPGRDSCSDYYWIFSHNRLVFVLRIKHERTLNTQKCWLAAAKIPPRAKWASSLTVSGRQS